MINMCRFVVQEWFLRQVSDCHHGQTAICKLCVEPPGFGGRVICCKQWRLPSKISWCTRSEIPGSTTSAVPSTRFDKSHVSDDLEPTTDWHHTNGLQTVWNLFKCQAMSWV